jgi:hypothetical protein
LATWGESSGFAPSMSRECREIKDTGRLFDCGRRFDQSGEIRCGDLVSAASRNDLFFRMPFLSPKAPRRFASHEQSRKTVRQAHRRKKRRELSNSDATNPELRLTITMCNRHDPKRVSPNDVDNVVGKSVQIYSAISFRP